MKRLFTGVAGVLLVAFAIAFMASEAQADTVTQAVGEAGTVTFTIDGNSVAFVGADPADGWTYTVDRADGDHLKVTFRNATGAEIEFEVEAGGSGTSIPGETTGITFDDDDDDDDTTSTSFGDTTGTTIDDDDDDDDDDNSGPGSGDDDDDSDANSGPGSDDDDDDSDDNSGPGSGDDDDDSDDNSGPGSGDDDDDDDDEDDDDDDDTSTSTTSTTIAG